MEQNKRGETTGIKKKVLGLSVINTFIGLSVVGKVAAVTAATLITLTVYVGVSDNISFKDVAEWVGSLRGKETAIERNIDNNSDIEVDPNMQNGEVDASIGRTEEEIQEELNKKAKEGMMSISMNSRPVFSTGKSAGNLLISNRERNKYSQIVEIVRDDTGETIYKSGLIPIGTKIEKAKLDVVLKKGTYECTAYFKGHDGKTKQFTSKAGAKIVVTVLE